MITDDDVRDLRPGDVVELIDQGMHGATLTGPLYAYRDWLMLGACALRNPKGKVVSWVVSGDLRVISRAPRPYYVNHRREQPEPGDVVRNANPSADGEDIRAWLFIGHAWVSGLGVPKDRSQLPNRLVLLVDGETGQVVPQ